MTHTVAVIPVRGGSVGIPRKNARFIGGKPLLAYSIEASLSAESIQEVFVSTDDPELSEIATRFGARVLSRPGRLASDTVTLDDVICHAACQLVRIDVRYDLVATIQATVPLLKPSTIDRAVRECVNHDMDTVLTVFDDPHLAWSKDTNGNLYPLYTTRSNRQQLPPYYKETGGVVVAKKKTIESGSRFGEKVGVVEVDKLESLDIDDYFDWWLVEKSLARRRILFHVIGDRETGVGHVYRALSLADRLIDHDVSFLVNDEATLAEALIRKRFYPCTVVAAGEEQRFISQMRPDIVINDILDTSADYVGELGRAGITTVNFEDLGEGSKLADYVINALYDAHPSRRDSNTFHGVEYDCLRDEFITREPIGIRNRVRNILLLFGGTDPNDFTLKCLRWLDEVDGDWNITVVTGLGYRNLGALERCATGATHQVEVIRDTPIVSKYMAQADIAITSAGRTVLELASLGVPMIVVAQNEREQHHTFARTSPGTVFLGSANEISPGRLRATVSELVSSRILRQKLQDSCLREGIRDGIHRILEILDRAINQSHRKSGS